MEFLIRFLKGFLLVQIRGNQLERFINLCRNRDISLRKMSFNDEVEKEKECKKPSYEDTSCEGVSCKEKTMKAAESVSSLQCLISINDFKNFQPIRRKTHVHIKILKKHGMPFFFLHHKKRKAFFLGLVCSVLVVWMLSGRIWTIRVEGNVRNTTPEILKFLQAEGINHGMKSEDVDCGSIVETVRKNYEDVTWASAKLSGSTLTVAIKEGVLIEEVHAEETACDIVADKAGTIVQMVTRAGVPLKKQGEECEVGELLIQGQVEILNDSKEVVRYEYVAADADIYIQYKIPYYKEFSLNYTTPEETGQKKYGLGLKIGNFYIEAGGSTAASKSETFWQQTKDLRRIQITESFYLPFQITKIESREYKEVEKTYTNEEAKALALKELHKYEENLIQKGVQIFVNNVTIKFNQKICVSQGYLEVIEKIGKSVPIDTQEQPIRKDIEE